MLRGLGSWCTHHLLVLVTCAMIAGTLAAKWMGTLFPSFAPTPVHIAVFLGTGGILFLSLRRLRLVVILLLFFGAGLIHTSLALHPPTGPPHLRAYLQSERMATTLVGTVRTMPEYNGENTRFQLDTESLLLTDTTGNRSLQPVRGLLLITLAGPAPQWLQPGARIMAPASLDRFHRYQTPGAFDLPLHMAAQGLSGSAWVKNADALEPVQDLTEFHTLPLNGLKQLRYVPEQMRQHMARFLDNTLPPDSAGIYQALLLGSRARLSPGVLEAFKASGCFHLLAISGLHFSLLALFASCLFYFLLKRSQWLLLHTHVPTLALVLTAPVLLLYAFIAGLGFPALRALLTALLVLIAVLLRRQRSLIPLIAAAALAILIVNPLALFTASFQLSFAAVLAINLIYPRLPVFHADPHEENRWRYFLHKGWQLVLSLFFVSLAATAGTLPLMLYHFNRVSLAGPLLNLIIEPLLCLWALPCGLAAVPCMWLAPKLATLFLHLGALGIKSALCLLTAVTHFTDGSLWVITPSFLEICFFVGLLICLLRRPAILFQRGFAALLALLLAGSFTFSLWNPWPRNEVQVHYLDVGQGMATLLQLPGGSSILIDGGGYQSDRFDMGEGVIAPFLWGKHVWHLDAVVITHPHSDHYNGLPFILRHFHPKRLIINGATNTDPSYQALLRQARQAHVILQPATAGMEIYADHAASLRCLGMPGIPGYTGETINDRSLVLRLQFGKTSFLFPADISVNGEEALLTEQTPVQSQVLLAPHHGSLSSSSLAFIAAVHPQLIMVSVGRNRRGVLPAPEHLRAWRRQNIPVFMTADQGTLTVASDGKNLQLTTFSGGTQREFQIANRRETE